MPEAFDRCVRLGGRVRTKKLSKGRYIHICYRHGKSYAGEVKGGGRNRLTQMSKERYS